jgi:hypothetical protein
VQYLFGQIPEVELAAKHPAMRHVDLAAALTRHRLAELEERLRAKTEEPSDAEIEFEVASLRALPRAFRPPRTEAVEEPAVVKSVAPVASAASVGPPEPAAIGSAAEEDDERPSEAAA